MGSALIIDSLLSSNCYAIVPLDTQIGLPVFPQGRRNLPDRQPPPDQDHLRRRRGLHPAREGPSRAAAHRDQTLTQQRAHRLHAGVNPHEVSAGHQVQRARLSRGAQEVQALGRFHCSAQSQTRHLAAARFFYLSGRDIKYRPVIVVNVPQIIDASLPEKTFYEVIGYFFQFVVQNCMVEGQIQTWITIVDLGKLGMFSLGGTVIDTIKFLSSHFRCRLHKNYLVNCPGSITFLFGMVKKAMTQDQINKIVLTEDNTLPTQAFKELFQDDIQCKYGGKKPDLLDYWPPHPTHRQPTPQQKLRLITVKQYGQKHSKGLLNKTKISRELLAQYEQIKSKCLAQRSPQQLMLQKIEVALKQEVVSEVENEECEGSGQEPPEIHLIPQPFLMGELFQFQYPLVEAVAEDK